MRDRKELHDGRTRWDQWHMGSPHNVCASCKYYDGKSCTCKEQYKEPTEITDIQIYSCTYHSIPDYLKIHIKENPYSEEQLKAIRKKNVEDIDISLHFGNPRARKLTKQSYVIEIDEINLNSLQIQNNYLFVSGKLMKREYLNQQWELSKQKTKIHKIKLVCFKRISFYQDGFKFSLDIERLGYELNSGDLKNNLSLT